MDLFSNRCVPWGRRTCRCSRLAARVGLRCPARALAELTTYSFFYLYSLVGTSVVFAIAGYVAGVHAESLKDARQFYHSLSEHDALTGLLNARAFHDRYRRSLAQAKKMGAPMALLMVDLDHLKQINDERGHAEGSAALVRVADAIRQAKRGSDDAARWGGDEFGVLLLAADATAARRTAESIMRNLKEPAGGDPNQHITVTIGIAAYDPLRDNDVFADADAALYAGKRGGRNQIYIADSAAATRLPVN